MMPVYDVVAAMAWADRLYAPLGGRSYSYSQSIAERALEAYRAISRKHPEARKARLGAARCLFRMGRYRASVAEYLAFDGAWNERATAIEFATTATRLQPLLPPRHILIHLVRTDRQRWVAVTGQWKPVVEDDSPLAYFDASLQQFRVGRSISRIGESVALNPEIGPRCEVNVFAPPELRPFFSVQSVECKGASAIPCDVQVFRARTQDLKASKALAGIYRTEVWMQGRTLCASVCPTYKLVWYDVYDWQDGAFRFANIRHPDRYASIKRPKQEADSIDYGGWAHYATALTIRRRRPEAIHAWRQVERILIGHLKEPERYYGRFFYFDGYGDAKVNLAEVRQRIKWLERRDWRHTLLYRPYDFNLQVPPYRLGRAGGED